MPDPRTTGMNAMQQEQTPPELQAQPATMTARVQITRANTGKIEEYDLTFTPVEDQPKEAE